MIVAVGLNDSLFMAEK